MKVNEESWHYRVILSREYRSEVKWGDTSIALYVVAVVISIVVYLIGTFTPLIVIALIYFNIYDTHMPAITSFVIWRVFFTIAMLLNYCSYEKIEYKERKENEPDTTKNEKGHFTIAKIEKRTGSNNADASK